MEPSGDNQSYLVNSQGEVFFCWNYKYDNINNICLSKWVDDKFVCIDGSKILTSENANVSNNSGFSGGPSLQLDPSGNLCIAWRDVTPGHYQIFFARWNGSSWVNAQGAALTLTNGNVSNNSGNSFYPSLQLDSSGNPCIAWSDNTPGNDEIFFARWNGSSWVNAQGATLTGTNGNVSNSSRCSRHPSLQLDSAGNPCIAWRDDTSGNTEIFFARWNGTQQGPRLPVRSFIKEVDTDGDRDFNDDGEPVTSSDGTVRYRITLVFENGASAKGFISDRVPYRTTYIKGCVPAGKAYYIQPQKDWGIKEDEEGDPDDHLSLGTVIKWWVDSADGQTQTFEYKIKVAPQQFVMQTGTGKGFVPDMVSAFSDPGFEHTCAKFTSPLIGLTMESNAMSTVPVLFQTQTPFEVVDPTDSETWPLGAGARLEWYRGTSIPIYEEVKFVLEADGVSVTKKFRAGEGKGVFPLDYNTFASLGIKRGKYASAILKVYIGSATEPFQSIRIKLARHAGLNHAAWADNHPGKSNRWPLIFLHGINLGSTGSAEESCFDEMLESFKYGEHDLTQYFKPFTFHYDSSDFVDNHCDYEELFNYGEKSLDGIEAVGFELKQRLEELKNNDPQLTWNKEFYFVCHSMGGLVARSFMAEQWSGTTRHCGDDVARVVTLATPHHGSPVASISLGGKLLIPSKFLRDLSWDNYDRSLGNEVSPNLFLKKLNNVQTIVNGNPVAGPVQSKKGFPGKIVALAGVITNNPNPTKYVPGIGLAPWFGDTNNFVLNAGHIASSWLGVANLPVIRQIYDAIKTVYAYAVKLVESSALIGIGISNVIIGNDSVEFYTELSNGITERVKVQDIRPFSKSYPVDDGIVPLQSALYENPAFSDVSYSQDFLSKHELLFWKKTRYYNHFTICSDDMAINHVKHALCAPVLKVTPPKIVPGEKFVIEGLSFGDKQEKTALYLDRKTYQTNILALNRPLEITQSRIPLRVISWSNTAIECQLPEEIAVSGSNVAGAGTHQKPLATSESTEYEVALQIGGNGIISPVTLIEEDGGAASIGTVTIVSVDSRIQLRSWPNSSVIFSNSIVEFTVHSRNTGNQELKDVVINSIVPRQLKMLSSIPSGPMSSNSVRFRIGSLKPGASFYIKIKCKPQIPAGQIPENGTMLFLTSYLTSGNNISTQSTALTRLIGPTSVVPVSMDVTWKGLNTKTNVVNLGTALSLEIKLNGGSPPYTIDVEWGDGGRSQGVLEQKDATIFDHSYKSRGEYEVVLTCSDSFGRSVRSSRKIRVE